MKFIWCIKEVQLVNTEDAGSRMKSILRYCETYRTLKELFTGSVTHTFNTWTQNTQDK